MLNQQTTRTSPTWCHPQPRCSNSELVKPPSSHLMNTQAVARKRKRMCPPTRELHHNESNQSSTFSKLSISLNNKPGSNQLRYFFSAKTFQKSINPIFILSSKNCPGNSSKRSRRSSRKRSQIAWPFCWKAQSSFAMTAPLDITLTTQSAAKSSITAPRTRSIPGCVLKVRRYDQLLNELN